MADLRRRKGDDGLNVDDVSDANTDETKQKKSTSGLSTAESSDHVNIIKHKCFNSLGNRKKTFI